MCNKFQIYTDRTLLCKIMVVFRTNKSVFLLYTDNDFFLLDAKEYFKAELQGDDGVKISTTQDIPESLAAGSPYTVLTLKASAPNSVNAYTVITVALVDGPGKISKRAESFQFYWFFSTFTIIY